ncbi:unnamed protein product [Closterium sp. Naga37s-1]|nr:unnamed protein product [Closterium sp. Naga37s-1]
MVTAALEAGWGTVVVDGAAEEGEIGAGKKGKCKGGKVGEEMVEGESASLLSRLETSFRHAPSLPGTSNPPPVPHPHTAPRPSPLPPSSRPQSQPVAARQNWVARGDAERRGGVRCGGGERLAAWVRVARAAEQESMCALAWREDVVVMDAADWKVRAV